MEEAKEEDSGELTAMERQHRKERKELQAKIQALKKAAKNDKTKKKELTAEITRLETDLEMKQQAEIKACLSCELDNIKLIGSPGTPEDMKINEDIVGVDEGKETEPQGQPVKLSKAQKRRDRKAQKDKEREELIKLQEQENLHGPRITEMKAIGDKLNQMKLKIFPIASDGDCLYQAVSHQLLTKKKVELSALDLRKKVSAYMREHRDDFLPFMSNFKTCSMLTEDEFEAYCDKVITTKVWGGQLEIRAMSNSLKCPITVIQATGPDSIDQGSEFEGPPLLITYHRHLYNLGEHFNSTTEIQENEAVA